MRLSIWAIIFMSMKKELMDTKTVLTAGHEPEHEVLNQEDYRTRHSFYKLDPDLRAIHQQHPFITVWDDHETANDSYKDGAENHDEATEGDWQTRKSTAKDVYFEWMPIRDNADNQIYRNISYGDLMDLILLDTRIEGRVKQVDSLADPTYKDPSRTMLGETQKAWYKEQLSNSTAQWKIVGNQVIFSPFNTRRFIKSGPGS